MLTGKVLHIFYENAFHLVLVKYFCIEMSEAHFSEVDIKMQLKMQNWMVLFPATGHFISAQ